MQDLKDAWTTTEKDIAQEVFQRAYDREIHALIQDVREKARAIAELDDLWRLHDYLSARRHEIDGKYEYDYSSLLFIFAELVRDGWLQLEELKPLSHDKLAKIAALTKM